jgi:transcription elongation factor GreA
MEYTIVGATEADPIKGMISCESPLGVSFLGKKVDAEVEVKTPAGVVKYKIISIQ